MSSRRVLAAGVAVGLLAPVAALSPASATEAAAPGKPLTASVGAAVAGERVTFTAKRPTAKKFRKLKAKQQRKATIVLQRRDGSAWRAVGRVKLGAKKKVTFVSAVPAKAKGSVRYRVRAVLGKKTYDAGALTLKVVTQQLTTRPSSSDADVATTYASTLTPVRAGRKLTVERYVDGTWSTVAETSAKGANVALAVAAARFPAWYRVRAAAHNGIASVATAPVRTTLTRRPVEIAHRAGASLGPEQTLGAMEASLAAGATAMEVDVQLTKDGVPVIVHDQTFARTTNVATVFPGREGDPVGSFTWDEVQQLDAGSWFGAEWAGQRIPSLDGLLTALDGRAHLVLEVKFHSSGFTTDPGTPEQRAALHSALDAELATGQLGDLARAKKLTVSSFSHSFLRPFAEAHPEVPVGALTYAAPAGAQLTELATWAEQVHAAFLPPFSPVTWEQTRAVHAAGLTTSLWTLVTPAHYRSALASGAEGLITDRPGLLASVLEPPAPVS